MKYFLVATISGLLATSAVAGDGPARLNAGQLDTVSAGSTAAAGGAAAAVGNFLIANSGSASQVAGRDTGIEGADTSSGVAAGQGYGASVGGGSAAASGASTTAKGNVQVGVNFGQNLTIGGVSLSTSTSASSGANCIICVGF